MMIPANEISINDKLWKVSNPNIVQKNANKYYGNTIVLNQINQKKNILSFMIRKIYILALLVMRITHFIKTIEDY